MDISWEALYIIICAPALLLAANFMFGSCTVADALEQRVDGMKSAHHSKHRTIGRCSLVGVLACTAWQYWECQFVIRIWEGTDDILRCNPVSAAYATIDAVSGALAGVPQISTTPDWWDCSRWELSYLSSLSVMLYLLWFCVTSNSQVRCASPATSFCSKCMSHVLEMDHHCYFLHNCVGAKNRIQFLALVTFVGVVALHVFARCPLAFVFSTWHSLLGYLVTIVVFCGALCLGTFQALLLRKGLTTVQFLKQTRHKSWLRAIVSLL